MKILFEKPAVLLGKTLVVADLHIGIEEKMFSQGIRIGSITQKMKEDLILLIKETGAKRLIVLGDAKDRIIGTESVVREFFGDISRHAKVTVVKGNHDGGLEQVECIEVAGAGGIRLKHKGVSYGLFHGHAWPSDELLGCDYLICGHQHPRIMVHDAFGNAQAVHAWIEMPIVGAKAKKRYGKANGKAKLLVMPPFNHAIGGQVINRQEGSLMGPLFASGMFKLSSAHIYTLSGISLGAFSGILEKRLA